MPGLSRRAGTSRDGGRGTLGGRRQGFAARAVVAVELAAGVDGDADRRLPPHRLEVVPAFLGPEDEVARARMDGAGFPLDIPVDLALEHDPPFVVEMIVRVVQMAGQVTDDEGLDVVGHHERVRPGRRALARAKLVDTGPELSDVQ